MSEKIPICGFLIVRVPGEDYDSEDRSAFYDAASILNGTYYSGIDRMPWWDIDDLYYAKALDGDLYEQYSELRKDDHDGTGLVLGKSVGLIKALKTITKDIDVMNEIIAVVSPKLGAIKGYMPVQSNQIRWLGYDVVSLGNWSLLRDGVFRNTEHFRKFVGILNGNGLFSEIRTAQELIPAYLETSNRGDLGEVLPESLHGTDIVRVGRYIGGTLYSVETSPP